MDLHMRTAPPGRLCSLPPKLRLGLLWLLSRPGGARAAAECSLVRQISSEEGREGHQGGDCVYGVTYGCHGGVVWVATGCQAVVSCAGSGHVRCLSRWSSNVTCPCSAARDTAMQSQTVLDVARSTRMDSLVQGAEARSQRRLEAQNAPATLRGGLADSRPAGRGRGGRGRGAGLSGGSRRSRSGITPARPASATVAERPEPAAAAVLGTS